MTDTGSHKNYDTIKRYMFIGKYSKEGFFSPTL